MSPINANEEGKYACTFCEKEYDIKSSYYTHVRLQHKKEKEALKGVVDEVVKEVVEVVKDAEEVERVERLRILNELKEVEEGNLIDLDVLLDEEDFVDAVEVLEEGLGLNVELETLDNSLLKAWMDQRVEVESLFGVNLTSNFAGTMEREVIVEKELKLKAEEKKVEFLRKQVEELNNKLKEEKK